MYACIVMCVCVHLPHSNRNEISGCVQTMMCTVQCLYDGNGSHTAAATIPFNYTNDSMQWHVINGNSSFIFFIFETQRRWRPNERRIDEANQLMKWRFTKLHFVSYNLSNLTKIRIVATYGHMVQANGKKVKIWLNIPCRKSCEEK